MCALCKRVCILLSYLRNANDLLRAQQFEASLQPKIKDRKAKRQLEQKDNRAIAINERTTETRATDATVNGGLHGRSQNDPTTS